MGFIEKIKRENDRLKKSSPYNYCDRWCERCAYSIKDCCKLYQDNFDFNLQCMANGIDPNDPKVILESERKNLEKTLELIAKIAKEENIDLNFDYNKNTPKRQKSLRSHPLYLSVIKFVKSAQDFISGNFSQDNINPDTFNDFETLNWYHTLLPIKIYRFLCDLYAQDPLNHLKNDSNVTFPLSDAVAQVEICLKCINESKKALSNIFSNHIECRYSISDMLELLEDITKNIKIILSEIDNRFK